MIWFPLMGLALATDVTVTVVDSQTGGVVPNAVVSCLQQEPLPTAVTSSSGKATVNCVAGTRQLKVFHDRFGSKVIPVSISGEKLSVRVRLENPAAIIVEDESTGGSVTRHVVSAEELKKIPGTFGDPVQALQVLPGVARPNIAEGSIVVRGAEGINTGFYVDGMPVPYMFHSLVSRSIIIPPFIDDIEFFPGGMPSKYGEVTQSVINVRTDTQSVEGRIVNLRVDFLDGGISWEERINQQTVLRVAGRYSWVGGIIANASRFAAWYAGAEDFEPSYLTPEYWDGFADLRYKATAEDEISLMLLSSRDTLVFHEGRSDEDGDGELDPFEWEEEELSYNPQHWIDSSFWRARLRWVHTGEMHDHETWVAGGLEEQQNLLGAWWLSRQGPYRGRVGGSSVVARRDDRWKLNQFGEGSGIVHGTQITARWFTAEDFQETFDVQDYSELEDVVTEDQQLITSAWIEPQWSTEQFYVGAGLRAAFYAWENQNSFQPEPRLTTRVTLPDEWIIKAAVGRYSQLPPLERYAQGIGNPNLDVMKAWQGSIGTEGELSNGISLDASFFGGHMTDLVVRDLEVDVYNNGDIVTTELQPYYLGVEGIAYGLEVLARVKPQQQPWWGWVSMTLAKAWRLDDEGNVFPSDYDQPISFNAVGNMELGKRWEMSGRVQYTSGQPFTPLSGVYVPDDSYFTAMRGALNSDRYPDYFRLDLRVQKELTTRHLEWMIYLDVYNVTARQNPFIATYNYDYTELLDIASIPIIPTLGIEATY